jgi:hypothetical protein
MRGGEAKSSKVDTGIVSVLATLFGARKKQVPSAWGNWSATIFERWSRFKGETTSDQVPRG